MTRDLQGLPIAISGAGTGIGRACAIACARAGMPVALGGRREAPLREAALEITRAGGKAIVVPTDVANEQACRAFVEATVNEFGTVYAVFANAGYGLRGPVHKLSDRAIRDIFETNFWGSVFLCRAGLDHMLEHRAGERHKGHLLMCSSCLSKLGTPFTSAYSASKAMQDHIGRGMRHELAPLGISVSTVHPIGTRTEFFGAAANRTDGVGNSLAPPKLLTQPADRVARGVVSCLRKPRGEVWTSHSVRLAMALITAFPNLADVFVGRAFESVQNEDRDDANATPG